MPDINTIVLTVNLLMGPGKDDLFQTREMKSLRECFDAARAWDAQEPDAVGLPGVVGFSAGCAVTPTEGRDG